MTPSSAALESSSLRPGDPVVGEPDLAPGTPGAGFQGTDAKIMNGQQALHKVMYHFLTSTAI